MPYQVRIGRTQGYASGATTGGTEGVDYIELPISSTYKTTSSTAVDSSRNIKGFVVGKVTRAGIRKIELSWRVISIQDYAELGTFFNTNFFFYAHYFDQDSGEWQTRHFYVGDREADAFEAEAWQPTQRGGRIEPTKVQNLKLSLIEV